MNDFLESFNKIGAPQRFLILLLVLIAILVGFYLLVYTGLEDGIELQKNKRHELLTQETDIKRKVANKEAIMAELDELKDRKEKVEKVLPAKAEIPQLLQKIQGQARLVNLEIRRFEPGAEKSQALYTEIPVSMELRGTFDQLADFFFNIGRMDRIVNIKNISIERSSGGPFGQGNLRVLCEATTYRSGGVTKALKKKKKK